MMPATIFFESRPKVSMSTCLTDSGTSAMSDDQWAGMMMGDESYAGSKNYYHFEATFAPSLGSNMSFPPIKAAWPKTFCFPRVVKPDMCVPNNIHFDTTRANIEHQSRQSINAVVKEAYDPHYDSPFKGNMDVIRLEEIINRVGRDRDSIGVTDDHE